MEIEEFRQHGKEMVDYICDYLKNLLPKEAPEEPEEWDAIMHDVKTKIMMGVTHWQHPRFHAYFPAGNSFPSILGDMLSDAIGCIGFSWDSSPACTELEMIVLDWFGRAIGLPDDFILSSKGSTGGGVLQSSASDCVLLTMLVARNEAINYLKTIKTKKSEPEHSVFLSQLVGYCSKESHSCVEKAAKILLIKLRILEPDDNGALRGETLKAHIEEDKARGLLPFFVSAILGSTASCSFDNLTEIGVVCKEEKCCWLHVDAAYAGSAFICPELKYLLKGIEFADSFNVNPNKWLLVNFDCSCLWIRNKTKLTDALTVNPIYLQHAKEEEAIDYRHWGIPLSRRFRSLKLWFVFRKYGLSGLRSYIRNHIKLARYFEKLVKQDGRFEVVNDVRLGLVCFRLLACDKINVNLLEKINSTGKLLVTPAKVKNKFVIRFCVNSERATKADIDCAWEIIGNYAKLVATNLLSKKVCAGKLKKCKAQRAAFVRNVSREQLNKSVEDRNLTDLASPVLVSESDEEI